MKRKGYAQVEPNHLSAQYTGQIYAQLPALNIVSGGNNTPIAQLENGQFLKYSYKNGCATVGPDTGEGAVDGEWMLVYNEEKLYDERHQHHKDFVMLASDMADGKIYPRLLKTNVGDIFTTNAFKSTSGSSVTGLDQEITMADLALGDYVTVGADGWLAKANSKPASGICFQVVPHFTQLKDDGSDPDAAYITTSGVTTYNYHLADMQDAVKLQRIQ